MAGLAGSTDVTRSPPATSRREASDDVIVRWFEPGPDDEPYVDVINTSFADHPSPLQVTLGTRIKYALMDAMEFALPARTKAENWPLDGRK